MDQRFVVQFQEVEIHKQRQLRRLGGRVVAAAVKLGFHIIEVADVEQVVVAFSGNGAVMDAAQQSGERAVAVQGLAEHGGVRRGGIVIHFVGRVDSAMYIQKGGGGGVRVVDLGGEIGEITGRKRGLHFVGLEAGARIVPRSEERRVAVNRNFMVEADAGA